MPRAKAKAKRKRCELCFKYHITLTPRQCLLGKGGSHGVLWKTLKQAMQCRDHDECVRCGVYCFGESQHMSHVYRAGRCGYLKYDLQNVKTLCVKCHRFWHDYEVESGLWFREKFPERWEYLSWAIVDARHNPGTIPTPFYRDRLEELRSYITDNSQAAKEERGL